MIHAGFSELKKAFNGHSKNAEGGEDKSHYLLLFYAVESGLKSVYLREKRLNTTEKITDVNLLKSHDLDLWVKELRLPAFVTGQNQRPRFQLKRDKESHAVARAHEAWRYYIEMVPRDQKTLTDWLKNIQGWIRENI